MSVPHPFAVLPLPRNLAEDKLNLKMFCPNCGTQVPEKALFCPNCGIKVGDAPVQAPQPVQAEPQPAPVQAPQPVQAEPQPAPVQAPQPIQAEPQPAPVYAVQHTYAPIGFGAAIKQMFTHYVDFNGRARRSEYWFMYLWVMIGMIIPFIGWYIWPLAIFLPMLAVGVRRLHDIGKPGTYILFGLIPVVGSILLIIWFCQDTQKGANEFGPDPKYID